jgi:nucleoside-diphosphate-sugar epimerase
LLAQGWRVRCSTRRPWANPPSGLEHTVALDIGPTTEWKRALEDVDVVFHLANRAHILRETAQDPAAEFERVNAAGTAQLARSARGAGVRRVVYVSSIGVHGDRSEGAALTESSPMRPCNAYTRSKVHGEAALQAEAGHGLEFVIVRPPLIYGAGVPGNFRRLMRLIASGMPMPLANIGNLRSYAAVGNVVDVLLLCGQLTAAAGEASVVADGDDLSTPDLVRTLAVGLETPARLVPFPKAILRRAARVAGIEHQFQQLCGTLQVNAAKAREHLGWKPKLNAREALMETARWYARSRID